jgi:hypothetical protein
MQNAEIVVAGVYSIPPSFRWLVRCESDVDEKNACRREADRHTGRRR